MNTTQIANALSADKYVSSVFRGVYPIDKLPRFQKGAYVFNTAASTHPGLHWVAVWVTHQRVEYFDSFGGDPPQRLLRWGRKKTWVVNPNPLQSPLSAVCGQYCIYFLVHRAAGIDLATILIDFDSDVDENDNRVCAFVNNRYDLDHNKLISMPHIQQCCPRVSNPSIRKIVSGQ